MADESGRTFGTVRKLGSSCATGLFASTQFTHARARARTQAHARRHTHADTRTQAHARAGTHTRTEIYTEMAFREDNKSASAAN